MAGKLSPVGDRDAGRVQSDPDTYNY